MLRKKKRHECLTEKARRLHQIGGGQLRRENGLTRARIVEGQEWPRVLEQGWRNL